MKDKDLLKLLLQNGWKDVRQRGSHHRLKKDDQVEEMCIRDRYREALVGFAPLLYYINLQSFFLFLFEVQQAMHREMLLSEIPSQERRSLDF